MGIFRLSDAKKEQKQIKKMRSYKKQAFVYYALKRPKIFIKVYEDAGFVTDKVFCDLYEINYEEVWPRLKEICYKSVKGEN